MARKRNRRAARVSAEGEPVKIGRPRGEDPQADISVNAKRMAEWLDISSAFVGRMVHEGQIRQNEDGSYPVKDNVISYINFLRGARKATSKSAAATRVQAARAREIELRTMRSENEVIDLEEVKPLFDEIFGQLKAALDGYPASVTRDLELRRKLESGLHEVLKRCAESFKQKASDLGESGEVADATAEDDA